MHGDNDDCHRFVLYTEQVSLYLQIAKIREGVMTLEPDSKSMPEGEAPKPKDFFSRLGGTYFSPRDAFREIGLSPQVLVPIIALIVISALVGFYLARNLDLEAMMAEQFQQAVADGRMTQEQMEQQAAMVSRFAGVQFIVGAPLASLAMTLIIAAVFKLISSLINVENKFKSIFAVTVYTMIAVSIIQSGLMVLVLYIKGPGGVDMTNPNSVVASNLGALLGIIAGEDALPKFFMKLAGYIDIFAIWIIALLAIGYAAVSRKLKTSRAAFWLGTVYAIVAVIGAAISSAFGR
jgi:UPF0716 family protein affecting phage T7 exclusion